MVYDILKVFAIISLKIFITIYEAIGNFVLDNFIKIIFFLVIVSVVSLVIYVIKIIKNRAYYSELEDSLIERELKKKVGTGTNFKNPRKKLGKLGDAALEIFTEYLEKPTGTTFSEIAERLGKKGEENKKSFILSLQSYLYSGEPIYKEDVKIFQEKMYDIGRELLLKIRRREKRRRERRRNKKGGIFKKSKKR